MPSSRFHRRLTLLMQFILLAGLVGAIWEQQWLNTVIISGIILLTLYPLFLSQRFNVRVPAGFQLLTITFVFASLFLGEVHGYYTRFWWWDIVLHASSGFLLGIIGFLLVYLLNETENIRFKMQPGFVALFAFMFALGMGTLWEIFEFTMDQLFLTNMQKPMFGDVSGLTDTMYDLIIDALGSLIIAIFGYIYLKKAETKSFLNRWIQWFIRANPQLFKHQNKAHKKAD